MSVPRSIALLLAFAAAVFAQEAPADSAVPRADSLRCDSIDPS